MNKKMKIKIAADIGMTVLLMLLMAFEMVGREAHEWIGIGMFVLFVLHHILNRTWIKNLFKGKYTPFRILQSVIAMAVLISMIASMVSGMVLSRYAFSFLNIEGGRNWARTIHMLAAYWGFAGMSVHLGLHWSMMIGMEKKMMKEPSQIRSLVGKIIGILIALYGIYAFFKREIGIYMTLQSSFVFFNFEEPIVFFFLDYLAVMGLFIWIGHYSSKGIKKLGKTKNRKKIT